MALKLLLDHATSTPSTTTDTDRNDALVTALTAASEGLRSFQITRHDA